MKSILFFTGVLLISSCSFHNTKTLENRMDDCKEGYILAMRGENSGLIESVIFQIVLNHLHGYLDDSEQLQVELARLAVDSENQSIRSKAQLALQFLKYPNNFYQAEIQSDYHDVDKLFLLMEKHAVEDPKYSNIR
jgi:hypothetical protein